MVVKEIKKIRNGPVILRSSMGGKKKYFLLDPRYHESQGGYTIRNSNGLIKRFTSVSAAEKAYTKRKKKRTIFKR